MNIQLFEKLSAQTHAGEINFGEVVKQLIAEGVESYRVDFVRKEITYYMPDGKTYILPLKVKTGPLAMDFSTDGIQSAVKDSQLRGLKFYDFVPRAMEAGVTNYVVYFNGKKVVYFGRKGEMHTEHFPGSN